MSISYEFELLYMNLRNSGKTGRGCFIYFSIKMKALKRCPPSHPVPNIVSDSGAWAEQYDTVFVLNH